MSDKEYVFVHRYQPNHKI